ncbi:MAG: hypothetical protein NTW87_30940 [Planctomycetota bacterium]|nr:hypothetical protein [Planctomycetota bacterium]
MSVACGLLAACCVVLSAAKAQDKDALAAAPEPAPNGPAEGKGSGTPPADVSQKQAATQAAGDSAALSAVFIEPDDGKPQVRLVAVKTDVARRYRPIVPPLPFPPFAGWRQWFRDHEDSVHCALEWRTENGEWFHGELRSRYFAPKAEAYRVGGGEFPGTAYEAYGIFIVPGRVPRDKDNKGQPIVVAVDERVPCDYREVEAQIRKYGAKNAKPGDPGTGGTGTHNVGLGGPAYKPAQNSNTMIKYVLRACGANRLAPDRALGWDTEPSFPYSSDADAPSRENQ